MPIVEYPFCRIGPNQPLRPMLPIQIVNPHTKQSVSTIGLIDTGADECAMPAGFADMLGHNLLVGKLKQIMTGNGVTAAYSHTTRINIFDRDDLKKIVYTIPDTEIDFMPNLQTVLLGARNFLAKFILTVDYPAQRFSVQTKLK